MRNRVPFRGLPAAFLALATLPAATASAQNPTFHDDPAVVERQVLAALNVARSAPSTYADTLRTYRGFFRANLVTIPGSSIDFETQEGTVPVDEAIDFLGVHVPLQQLEPGDILHQAAVDHVREQGSSGRTGHYGPDGSGPGERAMRHGGGRNVAEVIAYGATDAVDVIRQLIIDDGVKDRGHRTLMFTGHLRYAGVACGPHPEFGTVCVIDMGDTPDGLPGSAPRAKVQVAAAETGKATPSGQ